MELFVVLEDSKSLMRSRAYRHENAHEKKFRCAEVDCYHGMLTRSARSRLDLRFVSSFPMPPSSYGHPHPTTRRPPSHTPHRPPSPESHPLPSPLSIIIMNRLSDYDDQIIRATPYETLFDYRATVGHLLVSPPSARLSSLSSNIGVSRMSQYWPRTHLLYGKP